ncbi:MAG TPA: ABC-2 family transporter protein [Acidimicrobiia bacterium]|nr:ABC-2 family transporter protein [Acidimicrobiia bacterium]
MRALRLGWAYFRIIAANELQYRVNLVLQIFNSAITLATGFVAISLVFSHTPELQGWTRGELLVVMGLHIAVGGVIGALVRPGMSQFMQEIEEGTFDLALTKPADSQLLVSIRSFRIWQLVDVVVGSVVIAYGARTIEGIGGARLLAFLAAATMGVIVLYCLWLGLATTAFKITRADSVFDMFDGMYQAGRWPVSIYPTWLRGTLTFVVPLAFAITVPAETLAARLGPSSLLVGLFATTAVVAGARWLWMRAIRSYSGASA